MTKWKQVSGDVDFSGTGCVLARDNPSSRDVDLVRITPWLEMDSSALAQGYGFWDVCRTTIDYDDMQVENDDVQSAMECTGVDAEEYQKLDPAHKAAVIAEYAGYGDSTSTSDFAEALPAPIGQIQFWAGSENHDIESINDEMRREVTSKLYGGKFSSRGRLPTDEALDLAFVVAKNIGLPSEFAPFAELPEKGFPLRFLHHEIAGAEFPQPVVEKCPGVIFHRRVIRGAGKDGDGGRPCVRS